MVIATPLARSRWAGARWLVLAPHPDDETLGAGALIADAAARGRLGGIAFLTDGAGSHPPGTPGLVSARRRETGQAMRRLGAGGVRLDWIGWSDARPRDAGDPRYARDAARLGAILRRRAIDALAVTAAHEPHCDHAAAWHFARAAIRAARRPIALFAYLVWGRPEGCSGRRVRTAAMPTGRRRHALSAHRSQLTPRFGDGFRLAPERLRMPGSDTLYQERFAR